MKHYAAFFLLLFSISAYAEVSVTDDAGVLVTLKTPAQRIITLVPGLTELVYAAGAGDHLVAVANLSDYPEAAKALPNIGDSSSVDFERILALHPDLVIAWKSGNHPTDIARLRSMKIPVYVAEPERLTDIPRTLQNISALAGVSSDASKDFTQTMQQLQQQYSKRRLLRVFYEIWPTPLMTVNGKHMISDVIQLCGGEDVFANVPVLTPTVSIESVIAAKPDVIITSDLAMANAPKMPALENLPTIAIPADLIERQTPRVSEGAKLLCERLDEVRSRRY